MRAISAEKIGAAEVGLLLVGTLAAFGLASAFWRVGLRNYTGARA